MDNQIVTLTLPADPLFARSARMLAASLSIVSGLAYEEIEDVRMACEEGFILACGSTTKPITITFELYEGTLTIKFMLEDVVDREHEHFEYADLLLQSLCQSYVIESQAITLTLVAL